MNEGTEGRDMTEQEETYIENVAQALVGMYSALNEIATTFSNALAIGLIENEIEDIREDPMLNRFQKWWRIRKLNKELRRYGRNN